MQLEEQPQNIQSKASNTNESIGKYQNPNKINRHAPNVLTKTMPTTPDLGSIIIL